MELRAQSPHEREPEDPLALLLSARAKQLPQYVGAVEHAGRTYEQKNSRREFGGIRAARLCMQRACGSEVCKDGNKDGAELDHFLTPFPDGCIFAALLNVHNSTPCQYVSEGKGPDFLELCSFLPGGLSINRITPAWSALRVGSDLSMTYVWNGRASGPHVRKI